MKRDDVIRMARDAGCDIAWADSLERFAKLVYEKAWADTALAATHTVTDAAIALEREACAKLAEETVCDTHLPTGVKIYGWRVSKAIRSRT
jgi:hypothetical protein